MNKFTNVKKAIIAGGGLLPELVVEKLQACNIAHCIIALNDSFNSNKINPDISIDIGLVGKLLDILKSQNITEIIFAGNVKRPSFNSMKLDKEGAKLIAKITGRKILGDDNILSTVTEFLEKRNFKIVSISEILEDIITTKACLTICVPDKQDYKDIETASELLNLVGDFDVGQSCVIENGLVLGIEAAEGTDELIKRCKSLKKETNQSTILVKKKKPNQEEKIDLPTIGVNTIHNVIESGFKGIAIEAGYSFILGKEEVIKLANKNNIFIIGI